MRLRAYHFSVDDVLSGLLEACDARQALFEHSFFGFLNDLSVEFDADIDLYLFWQLMDQGRSRSLEDVSDSLQPFFQKSPWLRFGPHALDAATPPYAQSPAAVQAVCENTYHQIARIAGPNRTSRWIRLHYFSECYELASYLRSRDVDAMLTTDKAAVSYRLPPPETEQLRHAGSTVYSGIRWVRSHLRVEDLADRAFDDRQLDRELERVFAESPCAVVFTHEYELVRPEVREMARRILGWFKRRRIMPIGALGPRFQMY